MPWTEVCMERFNAYCLRFHHRVVHLPLLESLRLQFSHPARQPMPSVRPPCACVQPPPRSPQPRPRGRVSPDLHERPRLSALRETAECIHKRHYLRRHARAPRIRWIPAQSDRWDRRASRNRVNSLKKSIQIHGPRETWREEKRRQKMSPTGE
jgi:hypothetical protein